jgi:hypothetical protein
MPGAQKQKIRRHLQQRQLFSLRRITAVSVRASATQLSVTVRLGKRGRKTACYSDQIDHRNDPTRSRHHESLSSIGALAKWPGLPAPGRVACRTRLGVESTGGPILWLQPALDLDEVPRRVAARAEPAGSSFIPALVSARDDGQPPQIQNQRAARCVFKAGGGVVGGHDDGATLR